MQEVDAQPGFSKRGNNFAQPVLHPQLSGCSKMAPSSV